MYKILKPEITNVQNTVWYVVQKDFRFWVIFIVSALLTLAIAKLHIMGRASLTEVAAFSFWPLLLFPLTYLAWTRDKVAASFWKQVAEINGWEYRDRGTSENESGIMFRQGHSRTISNHIGGSIDGRQFRIFNYEFTIGSGKYRRVYPYTVFAFKFKGLFPHIYLNNKHNSYSINAGETIPLPLEFENKFSLSAPRKYEIEALQIFTPDVLENILKSDFIYDIEFTEQEIVMFVDGAIYDFGKLERDFTMLLRLEDIFDEKLDAFKFNAIGDMPHVLK